MNDPRLTEAELAALRRYRAMRKASDENDGGYPDTHVGRWQSELDRSYLADLALRTFGDDGRLKEPDCKVIQGYPT